MATTDSARMHGVARNRHEEFESCIKRLTQPLNGQFPRPWMSALADPLSARVLIVGRNQAKAFDASRLTHERHLDSLFNRNGESCRGVYDELTGLPASSTRKHIDCLREILAYRGSTQGSGNQCCVLLHAHECRVDGSFPCRWRSSGYRDLLHAAQVYPAASSHCTRRWNERDLEQDTGLAHPEANGAA